MIDTTTRDRYHWPRRRDGIYVLLPGITAVAHLTKLASDHSAAERPIDLTAAAGFLASIVASVCKAGSLVAEDVLVGR